MTEKLRSHLKSDKGFTLIELLVVIAIIAILVTIVLVAINPIARINEASQRDGQSRIRQVAGGVEACLVAKTAELNDPAAAATFCAVEANLTAAPGNFLKTIPTNVDLCVGIVAGSLEMVGIYNAADFGNNRYAYKTGSTGGFAPGSVFLMSADYTTCAALLGM